MTTCTAGELHLIRAHSLLYVEGLTLGSYEALRFIQRIAILVSTFITDHRLVQVVVHNVLFGDEWSFWKMAVPDQWASRGERYVTPSTSPVSEIKSVTASSKVKCSSRAVSNTHYEPRSLLFGAA